MKGTPTVSGPVEASAALRAMLAHAIDYAGLFPPAKLAMPAATEHYARCAQGTLSHALGRMVLPLARLGEFETELPRCGMPPGYSWRLSVLAGPDPAADAAVIQDFNRRQSTARIVSIETKATTPAEVADRTAALPGTMQVWVEVPVDGEVSRMIAAVRQSGHSAKIRTGGITAAAFPAAADVVRFFAACSQARVTAKATAGLHHPLRGDFSYSYEAGSSSGPMFGFMNVLLTAALIQSGGTTEQAVTLLTDGEPANFSIFPEAIEWREFRFTTSHLTFMRDTLCRSFGSCSFTEPLTGLQALGWL